MHLIYMASLQSITARYRGLRDSANRTDKHNMYIGKYYYVVIMRKSKYKYEFIGELLEFDMRGAPVFAYESTLTEKKCRWYCKPSDEFYELQPNTLPEDLQQDIHKVKEAAPVAEQPRRCAIL